MINARCQIHTGSDAGFACVAQSPGNRQTDKGESCHRCILEWYGNAGTGPHLGRQTEEASLEEVVLDLGFAGWEEVACW